MVDILKKHEVVSVTNKKQTNYCMFGFSIGKPLSNEKKNKFLFFCIVFFPILCQWIFSCVSTYFNFPLLTVNVTVDVPTKPEQVKRFHVKLKAYEKFAGVSCLKTVKFFSYSDSDDYKKQIYEKKPEWLIGD